MRPSKVLIIRHGEKPGNPGVDAPDDGADLSTKGYERAGALAPFVPATFGKPDYLFATKASHHSNRPVETITPLATALELRIYDEYADNEFVQLAAKLTSDSKYDGKLLLICWHHGTIPELTTSLGGMPPATHWPSASFDRVWVIDYARQSDDPIPVQDLPQRLLFGDTSE
jgi:hypothetical protein